MLWIIFGGTAVVVGLLAWNARRPKDFDYRGRRYTRHSDGGFTYADGDSLTGESERQEVQDYWESTHDSSSSDSGDGGGGDGGGGD